VGHSRQLWQLDCFTEGLMRAAEWTPGQISRSRGTPSLILARLRGAKGVGAGDLARRRRAKFLPGESAAKVVQTKEPQHKDDFDEWLARIICFAFSVPPQWATKVMNCAT
jgi:hypothetical protein